MFFGWNLCCLSIGFIVFPVSFLVEKDKLVIGYQKYVLVGLFFFKKKKFLFIYDMILVN